MINKLLAVSGSDAKNDFIAFLQKNVIWICVGICVIILLTILYFLFFVEKRNKNSRKK